MIIVNNSFISIRGKKLDVTTELALILYNLKEKLGTEESLNMINIGLDVVFKDELKIKRIDIPVKENTDKKEIEKILDNLPNDISKTLRGLL